MKPFRTAILLLPLFLAGHAGAQDVCAIDDNEVLIFGLTHEGVYVLGLEWIHDENGSPDRYRANIGDYPVEGWLEFADDALVACEYVFSIETGEGKTWSQAYFHVKSLLSEQYGQPYDKMEYLTGKYRDSSPGSEDADLAIARGLGYYRSKWDFDSGRRSMTLRLSGKDGSLQLVYRHFRRDEERPQEQLFP